jgi:hypothetical protein
MRLARVSVALSIMFVPALLLASAAAPRGTVGIVCNDNQKRPVVRHAPLKCEVLPPLAAFAEGLNLVGLQWRNWGGSSATGTGYERGFHLPFEHIPVAVVAYQIVTCSDGSRLYTRLRASSSYGTTSVRAQGCLR